LPYFSGARVFLTVALDIVMSGISEPVRFLIEAKARVSETNKPNETTSQDIGDTIWSSFKKVTPFTEEFDMNVKQVKINETVRVMNHLSFSCRCRRTCLIRIKSMKWLV
jgi:hypothetical protein